MDVVPFKERMGEKSQILSQLKEKIVPKEVSVKLCTLSMFMQNLVPDKAFCMQL